MSTWPVQDAKAKFSELLETCIAEGPQIVTRRGKEEAVLVPMDQWQKLSKTRQRTMKDVLLGDGLRFEMEIPSRGQRQRRVVRQLD